MMQIDTTDWNQLGEAFEALAAEPLTADDVPDWLYRWSNLESLLQEEAGNAASRSHENTADEVAEALYLHYVREILPKAEIARAGLREKLLAVEGYEPAEDEVVLFRRLTNEQDLYREENVPLEAEEQVLGAQHRKLTSALTITWHGERLTLQAAEQLLRVPSRETREQAWHLIHQAWLDEREALNEQYLTLLGLRRQIASNAGFENGRAYFWQARQRLDYDPELALEFHEAIEQEVVPVAAQLYEERRQKLGVPEFRPWDEVAPVAEQALPAVGINALEEGGFNILRAISEDLGTMFEELREGYLDLEERENKAPGGYCRSLPISRRSYIFMNAVGRPEDLRTLLHEGGHAYHNYLTFHLPLLWQRRSPMEFAEVASMGMEMLAQPYLGQDAGGLYDEDDARRARIKQLRKIVTFLPYMAVVDAFQHWVYTDAPEGVDADALDAKWVELWDRFMIGIDLSGLEDVKETGWHRKRHIFLSPFYYLEYGMAQVGALQLWQNARRDERQTLADYQRALALGGTRSLPELFETAGLRFQFDRAMLRDLMMDIMQEMGALEAA